MYLVFFLFLCLSAGKIEKVGLIFMKQTFDIDIYGNMFMCILISLKQMLERVRATVSQCHHRVYSEVGGRLKSLGVHR